MPLWIKPRLNYHFGILDFITGIVGLWKKSLPQAIQSIFPVKNLYFLNQARLGIKLILQASKLRKGAGVGVQVLTCPSVFQAINEAGYKPIFIDINQSFTISTEDLAERINKCEALIITHTYGIPAKMDEIKKIAYDKLIIEDCSHSFLTMFNSVYTGTLGDASVFSFGEAKFPVIGGGAMVLINKAELITEFDKIYNKLVVPSVLTSINQLFTCLIKAWAHKPIMFGMITYRIKYRKKNIQYACSTIKNLKFPYSFSGILNRRLRKVIKNIMTQQYFMDFIYKTLANNPNIIVPPDIRKSNGFLFPFLSKNREMLIKKILSKGYETGKHFSDSIIIAKKYEYISGTCPNSEKISKNIMTLPCHYNYSFASLQALVKIINDLQNNDANNY